MNTLVPLNPAWTFLAVGTFDVVLWAVLAVALVLLFMKRKARKAKT